MFKKVSGIIGKMVLGAVALITPSIVSADQIALTFEDHGFTIVGEFSGFRENAYVVKTSQGEIYVPVNMVTCEGEACIDLFQDTES